MLRHDISGLEAALKKAEQEKQTRDNQIKSLNDEVCILNKSLRVLPSRVCVCDFMN